ncbi:hypothetical protein HHI36_012122 [Cryptolaemus montrouzieri]|uniref:Sphingomyelin phosphodiesterase C-terminal domain-containing protein n=1 Tax=Cryptolaemus montrouzieri TaxID=559131 RepID=A0ABD2NDN9_9CUCU
MNVCPLNTPSSVSTQWLFDAVIDYWSKWLPQSALETIKLGGYYTVLVRPEFRIIALNSNVCFTENFWLYYDDVDPYGQLKWLVEVLLKAEKNGEKVHILSHVPPGEAMCHRQWLYNFNNIVRRFADTISAHFNGHTHSDEFRIYKNENNPNEVINVAYNGGSFTTFIGQNPDYRVYDINPKIWVFFIKKLQFFMENLSLGYFPGLQLNNSAKAGSPPCLLLMVSDYHQYTFNLSLANENRNPNWYKLYSFKSAYKLNNLDYDSLLELDKRLSTEPELAEQYIKFYVRDSEFAFVNGCNKTCIDSQICHITAIDADESIKCGFYTVFN